MTGKLQRLLVVGAGPKAAAIAAKSRVLRELEQSAPEIWIIDKTEICANWTGKNGFTSGTQPLGTPPEKDVGFPYIRDADVPEVTQRLFAEYSWPSYLNFERFGYGEWIDRGRPHPTHKEWARYLKSVMKAADRTIIGECVSIEIDGDEWIVTFKEKGRKPETQRFSGIVITGPGERKVPAHLNIPKSDRIVFGDDFWTKTSEINRLDTDEGSDPIVIVGGGETSAAIVSYLVDELADTQASIVVLTRSGTIFSRGEGYYENRRFTDSSDWKSLPKKVREEVIRRGDRGVFSVEAMQKISNSRIMQHRFLEVTELKMRRDKVVINPGSKDQEIECQMLVLALGFDPFSFINSMPETVRGKLSEMETTKIEEKIGHDISLSSEICPAKLYLPMVSGLAQGPGFPNLSCLGNLSDRILNRN